MILNIYKPKNWTSFDVVKKVKNVVGAKKAGHAGTLDPLAEGVLIVLTDSDTKKQDSFMKTTKEYKCEIGFGAESPTYDLEGELTFQKLPTKETLAKKLDDLLPSYKGEIDQTVPPYSAKKVGGKPLYKKARAGTLGDMPLPNKTVEILDFAIDSLEEQKVLGQSLLVLKCTITCSSGTYVRSIAHDLGKDLGVGGVLLKLMRTKVGDFTVEESKKIEELVLEFESLA